MKLIAALILAGSALTMHLLQPENENALFGSIILMGCAGLFAVSGILEIGRERK